jgi:hypothetical protein
MLNNATVRFIGFVKSQNRFLKILSVILLPALIAVWTGLIEPSQIGEIVYWLLLILFFCCQIILYFISSSSDTAVDFYIENSELKTALEQRESELKTLRKQAVDLHYNLQIAKVFSTIQAQTINIKTTEDLTQFVQLTCSVLIAAFGNIFKFQFDERWNIAVYQFDEKNNILSCFWRRTSDNHPSKDKLGRTWEPGDGHVGRAFMQQRILQTTDA